VNAPKKHHYVPQFYLAGFTQLGATDDLLYVFDGETGKQRPSKPINEGYKKHLYRIDGDDPSAVESMFSNVENEASHIFREIVATRALPSKPADMGSLLTFAALQAVRPSHRMQWLDKANVATTRTILDVITAHEDRFRALVTRFEQNTGKRLKNPSRLDLRRFGAEAPLKTNNTRLVDNMLQVSGAIAETMSDRNWSLVIAGDDCPDFATSDNPVCIGPGPGFPPGMPLGFGSPKSVVTYPLTRRFALRGTFEDVVPRALIADRSLVAGMNSVIILAAHRFVWSRRPRIFHARDKNLVSDLAKTWQIWRSTGQESEERLRIEMSSKAIPSSQHVDPDHPDR
jgi:hypothetical protein